MPLCRNDVAYIGITASAGVGGISVLLAGRRCYYRRVIMSCCSNLGCFKDCATYGTLGMLIADGLAGRRLVYYPLTGSMTKGFGVVIYITVAAGASMSCIALSCTGGCCYACRVIVSCCGNDVAYIGIATFAGVGSISVLLAGCRGYYCCVVVSGCRNLSCFKDCATGGTLGMLIADGLAGCGLIGYPLTRSMTKGFGVVIYVAVTAGTSISCIALCCAGGCCYACRVVMPCCRNDVAYIGIATFTGVGGIAVLLTGCRGYYCRVIVSCCGNLGCFKDCSTYCTLGVLIADGLAG